MANSRVDPNTLLADVCFNGGNPNKLFRVWVDDMLKDLKDQLEEINLRLNLGDTRRMKYIWYERSSFNDERITFSRPELTKYDDVRRIFSIFDQHIMFPTIEMHASLLRSSEDILESLIRLDEYV